MTQRRTASRGPARTRTRPKPAAKKRAKKATKKTRAPRRTKPSLPPLVLPDESRLVSQAEASCFPGIAHPKKRAYLAAFVQMGNRVRASAAAGITRRTAYNWEHDDHDPAFQEAFRVATQLAGDLLEAEATRRAFEGVSKPVYQLGHLVGYQQEYSDTLLIFLLKGAMPEKYRERVETRNPSVDAFVKFLEEVGAPATTEARNAQT